MRRIVTALGFAVLGPAAAFWALRIGLGTTVIAASLASLLLAVLSLSPRHPPAWVLALAGASAVAWTRSLDLLWSHSFYALCGATACVCAGLAVGSYLNRYADMIELPRGLWAFASGLCGLLGLAWLRLIGINAGSAERLLTPLILSRDVLSILGPSLLAFTLWLSALAPTQTSRTPRWGETLLAAAGPWAAWLLIGRLTAPGTAAVCHLAMAAGGLAWAGRRLKEYPILSKAVFLGLAAGCLSAWHSRDLFHDVWINRLNAAWPGGRFLALVDDGRECLGAYKFSSGATVLLRDGTAWSNGTAEAKREAHLPLLMHGSAHRILLSGARHPATIASALSHAIEVTALDSHPQANRILAALAEKAWPPSDVPPGAQLKFLNRDLLRHLRSGGPSYDVIILEVPFPVNAPQALRLLTKESFREIKNRLAADGLAALRLPAPYPPQSLPRILSNAKEVFGHTGGFALPGGLLLIAADHPLLADAPTLLARRSVFVQADDFDLETDLPKLPWTDLDVSK